MVDTSVLDKSMRSVFVGNIPYETTEEKLKDIFSAVGTVLSFKLVFDRENGKPKGYGFCEYKDQETALSAMRNLNGYEIAGRSLRVDNACTEKSRLEMQSLMAGPPIDNTYGEPIDSEKAPEAISKAVASLPPEQMFELMKQMKLCIQNNPSEGRQMLLQNPQLAYALLQAQVVMRIVDPQTAVTMLHKGNPASNIGPPPAGSALPQQPVMAPAIIQSGQIPAQPMMPPQTMPSKTLDPTMPAQPRMPNHPSALPVPVPTQPIISSQGQDMDLRTINRMAPPPRGVMAPTGPALGPSPLLGPMSGAMVPGANVPMPPGPPVMSGDQDMRIPPNPIPPPPGDLTARDPRGIYPRDPRAPGKPAGPTVPQPQVTAPKPVFPAASAVAAASQSPSQSSASDQEKAALIMQVLQLSDDQIAMLPPEQRQSILVLKEQIAKSQNR